MKIVKFVCFSCISSSKMDQFTSN